MTLHTPTLLLVCLLITVTLGISMGLVARRERRDGMVWWAWAMVPLALTLLLFSLRGQIGDGYSVVLGNTFLVSVLALFAEGLCEFQQRPPRRWLIWGPVLATLLFIVLLMDNTSVRPLVSNLVLAAQSLMMLGLVFSRRHQTVGRGQYFLIVGLILVALAMLLRLGAAVLGTVDLNQVTSSHAAHSLSMLVFMQTIILITMGLILMSKERADALNRTLALQDELTGLHNRRAIHKLLEQQLALARRNGQPLALLIVDIDHFKQINDDYGHLSGDQALRAMAAGLQRRLRTQDIVGRWGGEEFIVILPGTAAAGARTLAETLRRSAEQAELAALDGRLIRFTISIGLHALDLAGGNERDDMIAAADRALYLAKQNGRNRVEEL